VTKYFLDCGTHLAQGLNEISKQLKTDHTWQVHSWEANPYTFSVLDKTPYPENYHFYNAAISDYNGTINLNVETVNDSDTGQGTSTIDKSIWKNSMHKGKFLKTVSVPCIDLSDWIQHNCQDAEFLAIKLDIEGAEYAVLEKMIKDCTLDLVNQIFIEWHARFFPNKEHYWDKQNAFIDLMRKKNINIVRWK
jgi:FkbM family methyltransferase